MVQCALVCITKNDQLYIEEYITYYLKLGFNTIFLYDNSERRDLKRWNQGDVKVIWFPGKGRQIFAYNHFLSRYKHDYDYVAFFDSDEFLVLKKHSSIQEFCQEHIQEGAIGINWYIFGNNGHHTYQNLPVLQRFTRRNCGMHPLVKTIVRCADIRQMGIHIPLKLLKGRIVNSRHQPLTSAENTDWDDSIAQINHYCTKSDEEYTWKINRGRGSVNLKRKYNELQSFLSLNFVEDNSALDFFQGISLKKSLAVVVFCSHPVQTFSFLPNDTFTLFVYSETFLPTENRNDSEQYFLQKRSDYQQHFLMNLKTSFDYVLFIEPGERIEGAFTDLGIFCKENLRDGVWKIKSKEKEEFRILAKCNDLLEVQEYEIRKVGFGVSVQETNKLFFS